MRKIIGINLGHDGGCSLCVDGKIIVSMNEERMIRVKHSPCWLNSLNYCLDHADLNLDEIDLAVFSYYNDSLKNGFNGGLSKFGFRKDKCTIADHHLSHACSTFFTSPFKKSLVFVLDAQGNNNSTESMYVANGNNIEKIAGNISGDFEKGIVAAYQSFTAYFGWNQNDAGKTMGLSSYGEEGIFRNHNIFSKEENGFYKNKLVNHSSYGLEEFCKRNKIKIPPKFSESSMIYKDLAMWIQKEFERVVVDIVDRFQKETGIENLCLSGGGALNMVCNAEIIKKTKVKNIHIFPAAGDSGQCIGNALFGYYIYGKNKRKNNYQWDSDFRKNNYSDSEINETLRKIQKINDLLVPRSCGFRFEKTGKICQKTAELISKGKIVGWFQGGSEIGPRSLGHRSILCDPRQKEMKDILNRKVKGRESFRPFACSVLLANAREYFYLEKDASPFMMFAVGVKEDKRSVIPAVTHVDGTCRIQTVCKNDDARYFELIDEFYKKTKVPLVLNTSFNLAGEPVVETPLDAIHTFLSTEMDCLVLGNYLVTKLNL